MARLMTRLETTSCLCILQPAWKLLESRVLAYVYNNLPGNRYRELLGPDN